MQAGHTIYISPLPSAEVNLFMCLYIPDYKSKTKNSKQFSWCQISTMLNSELDIFREFRSTSIGQTCLNVL